MSKLLIRLATKKSDNKRESLGTLSGVMGILFNTLLCIFKFITGYVSGSLSITADAVNNLSDAGSSIVTIAGTRMSNKPVDKEHPFGHGRIEYISALVISFFIFLMGFELGKSSVEKIISPTEVEFNIWYVIVLCVSILVKLYMAYFNNKLYKITDNINLKAVRQDSLNDCIATAAAIVALLISSLTSFKIADGIIGLFVAVIIILSGIDIVKDITGKLLGQAPSKKLVEDIESIMLSRDLIVGVHDLIIHDYGPNRTIASAHAEVPSTADIVEVHNVIDDVEKEISDKLKIVICIHMDPIVMDDEETDKYKQLIKEAVNTMNSEYNFHDFRMVKSGERVNLIFDLAVPIDKKTSNVDILKRLKAEVNKRDDKINLVVTVEHLMV